MTPSPEDLPAAIPSMWRLCKLGARNEPWLMVTAFILTLLAALPDALLALWLKFLGQGVLTHNREELVIAGSGLALSATATWLLVTFSTRVQRRFRDKVTIMLEGHVAGLQASISTIAHQERPEYLDRLSVLRDQVFVLDHMYMSVFSTAGWVLRLGVTVALLVSISPVLALLLVFALPTVVSSGWRPGVERTIQERVAPHARLARHLFVTNSTATSAKEVRLWRIGEQLARRRRAEWESWHRPIAGARWVTGTWNALAWMVFGAGYVGAIVYVSSGLHAGPGSVLLVLAAGSRLSGYLAATVGEIGFLRGVWLDGSRRLAWLEDYAAAVAAEGDVKAPDVLKRGIDFQHVSFVYPGTDKLVLDDVNLSLPAGRVVAVVGENGAGKTTFVKLLSKMYDPSAGRILIDGSDLRQMRAEEWRTKLAGAFQDFFRFEFLTRESVGVGDVPRMDDEETVLTAVARAGATDLVLDLGSGLDTQLGRTWPDGTDLSFGQWQKVALARGFMRSIPLVLVLDEPTAALDAETEYALFRRYADSIHMEGGSAAGTITILVSHRFSTVRMADLIVVLSGSRVVEFGTHEELMSTSGGHYAALYGIQASAYR